MRGLLRWLAAIAVGVAVFEGLDLLGSPPAAGGLASFLAFLPAISPFAAGAAGTLAAGPGAGRSLAAGILAVWARIGVDRAIGVIHGVHPPAEAAFVLVLVFGLPWTIMAAFGGASVVVLRWFLRLRRRRPIR